MHLSLLSQAYLAQTPFLLAHFPWNEFHAHVAGLEKLVRRIVKARGESGDVAALEAEVNERVCRLFGLTREEIALVESA